MRTAVYAAINEGLEIALNKNQVMKAWEKRLMRRTVLANWQMVTRDAVTLFRERRSMPEIESDEFDSETPFIDWLSGLFPDTEAIKDFMKFLVEEFLPTLFSVILAFISGL